jgi:hypothetical protein
VSASTAVAEAGSAYAEMSDANDVIVLKNTTIRAGTSGASTFDSNGGNAFAAAVAAGQISVGQKIFVEGLGIESGSVAFTSQPTAGSKVTASDGDKTVIFQFGGTYAQTVHGVDLGSGNSATASNFADAINALRVTGDLNLSATVSGSTVTIKNINATGGSLVETLDAGSALTVTNFSGGSTSLRGVFTLTAVTDDVLTVSPHPATFANGSAKAVTIKGSMLRNPADAADITPQSFSIETGFEDVSQFFVTDGLRVGTFSYNIASNAILTGAFAFNGRETKRLTASKLGAAPYTVLETTATPVANATVNVGAIKMNGDRAGDGRAVDHPERDQQPARPERGRAQVPGGHRRGPDGSERQPDRLLRRRHAVGQVHRAPSGVGRVLHPGRRRQPLRVHHPGGALLHRHGQPGRRQPGHPGEHGVDGEAGPGDGLRTPDRPLLLGQGADRLTSHEFRGFLTRHLFTPTRTKDFFGSLT